MKILSIAAGLLLSSQAFAADIYVHCKLEVAKIVEGVETNIARSDADARIKLPQTEPVKLQLVVPGHNASFYWNLGFTPIAKIEDEVNKIRTESKDWEVYIDRGDAKAGRTIAKLSCGADA